jgi:hypothetical protein
MSMVVWLWLRLLRPIAPIQIVYENDTFDRTSYQAAIVFYGIIRKLNNYQILKLLDCSIDNVFQNSLNHS